MVDEAIHITEHVISKYKQVRVGLSDDLLQGRHKSTGRQNSQKRANRRQSRPLKAGMCLNGERAGRAIWVVLQAEVHLRAIGLSTGTDLSHDPI